MMLISGLAVDDSVRAIYARDIASASGTDNAWTV